MLNNFFLPMLGALAGAAGSLFVGMKIEKYRTRERYREKAFDAYLKYLEGFFPTYHQFVVSFQLFLLEMNDENLTKLKIDANTFSNAYLQKPPFFPNSTHKLLSDLNNFYTRTCIPNFSGCPGDIRDQLEDQHFQILNSVRDDLGIAELLEKLPEIFGKKKKPKS